VARLAAGERGVGTRVGEEWLRRYRDQVGRSRAEVATPALLLELGAARRNLERMARLAGELGVALRPHVKAHKSAELARLQVEAGAIGVTCATVWEAMVMARGAGVADVLIANQVVGADKLSAAAALAREHRLTIAVDDADNLRALSAAAARAGSRLELLIEVDVGMGRAGVRSHARALELAALAETLPGLALRGVHGYEGHCMAEPRPAERAGMAARANQALLEAVEALTGAGHACAVVSAGGTGTYATTGANPGITEIQAGSYVLMDRHHERLVPGEFETALTVLATVVSRQGSTVVLDCGRKSVSAELEPPALLRPPGGRLRAVAEEHCIVDFDRRPPLVVGDTVELVHGYAPTGVNLHDAFLVLEEGAVVEVWPVNPRGSAPPPFV
jgi:D-serine deaminase-like pyridoxal phosphate-dependent protein